MKLMSDFFAVFNNLKFTAMLITIIVNGVLVFAL